MEPPHVLSLVVSTCHAFRQIGAIAITKLSALPVFQSGNYMFKNTGNMYLGLFLTSNFAEIASNEW